MAHRLNRLGLTWQKLTAAGIAFSMRLGIVIANRAHAQTIDKQNGVAAERMLPRYTRDVSAAVEQGRFDSSHGNQEKSKKAIEILARGNQNNPVLFTDSQAVRNVVIMGIARQISHGNVPENLLGRREIGRAHV